MTWTGKPLRLRTRDDSPQSSVAFADIHLSVVRCSRGRGVEDPGRGRGRGANSDWAVQGRVLGGPGPPPGSFRGDGSDPPGKHRAEGRQRAVLRVRDPSGALPKLCPPGRDLLGDSGV